MATISQVLDPTCGMFRTSAFPGIVQANGTNIPVRGCAFDASTAESVYFDLRAVRYGSGNVTVDFDWYADSATSGACIWGAQLAAITPTTDSQDTETDSLATAATTTTTHPGTTGQRLQRTTVTISSLDSLAADDVVALRVYRDAAAGGDTMTGDAILTLVTVSYSDS